MATAFITNTILDLNMLRYLGVSVKETDNPIGYFGTGLKYAIPILLRTGHEVEMIIDGETYRFEKDIKTFRGEERETVIMRHVHTGVVENLPITMSYGRDWEVWMAYRELVTNTMDEKGEIVDDFDISDTVLSDKTIFLVTGDEIKKCRRNHYQYFLRELEEAKLSDTIVAHVPSESRGIFYRGVCVHQGQADSPYRYTYAFNEDLALTEDRTLKNLYDAHQRIGIAVCTKTDDVDVIKRMVLVSPTRSPEANFDFHWSGPSSVFLDTVEKLLKQDRGAVNSSARACWEEAKQDNSIITEEFTNIQRLTLDRALTLLDRCGYTKIRDYPIKRMMNGHRGLMGKVENDTIYLTDTAFSYGIKTVMATLIEEYIHISTGIDDFSREMQDALLSKIIDLLEEHVIKEPI